MDNHLFEILGDIGVCATGKRYMDKEQKDLEFLAKIWKQWPEYLIEHSQKTVPILRSYLSIEDKANLLKQNIFFDFKGSKIIDIKSDTVFVCGDSECLIELHEWSVMKVYIFDHSKVKIICPDKSIVNIECYNESQIDVESKGNASIVIFQHDLSVVKAENAKIIEKECKRGEVFNGKEMTK